MDTTPRPSQGLSLRDLRQGVHYFARGGYGTAFHDVILDGQLLIAKCGKWISVATTPLTIIEHPPYAHGVCKKCDRR